MLGVEHCEGKLATEESARPVQHEPVNPVLEEAPAQHAGHGEERCDVDGTWIARERRNTESNDERCVEQQWTLSLPPSRVRERAARWRRRLRQVPRGKIDG